MPRKEGKPGPKGNGPVPHNDEFGFREPTMADLYRLIEGRLDKSDRSLERMISHFDQQDKKLDELME